MSRLRYCRCSIADRMNDRPQPNCPLHGDTPEARAYQDGLHDGANGAKP